MKGVTYLLPFLFLTSAIGQAIPSVPESLKKDAHEVIIHDVTYFKINSIDHSEQTRKYLTCIQDKYATKGNQIVLYYSDFRTINDARVTVYDQKFKKVDNYKLKDFGDWSLKGFSLADDSRAKYLEIKRASFPYYVEVEYSIEYKGSMFYPHWYPQNAEKLSVLHAELKVESSLESPFRYLSNIEVTESSSMPGQYFAKWVVDSLPSFEYQSFSNEISQYTPSVLLSPSRFQMDGIIGDLSSWKSYGDWIHQLYSTRNTLSPDQKKEIQALVSGIEDRREMVKVIYHYLQDHTRYVSIQLGLGGWQPFESGFVHEKKYGDCKALSFYTKSMLEAIGIDAFYTVIRAGNDEAEVPFGFPNAHFNHVILTVPLDSDTLFLECTSQTNPFGYQGTFTSDRNALLVKENGSKIIRTKIYKENDNIQLTVAKLKLDETGRGNCKINRQYQGIEIENKHFSRIVRKSEKEQNEWLIDHHKWGNMSINNLEVSNLSDEPIPKGSISAEVEILNAASLTGKRLFYNPFVFNNLNHIELSDKERKVPIELKYPYVHIDSIYVEFDEHFYPEKTMKDIQITSEFGEYYRSVIQDQNEYIFVRKFIFHKGNYPPDSYDSFKDFIHQVQKRDNERIVLIKET